MVEIGEAFSGAKAFSLREAVAVQSGRFFRAFHATNLQARLQCLCMMCGRTHRTLSPAGTANDAASVWASCWGLYLHACWARQTCT